MAKSSLLVAILLPLAGNCHWVVVRAQGQREVKFIFLAVVALQVADQ